MARRIGPVERLPQAIAEQVVRRIVEVIDVNEIVQRIDVNGVIERVDVNAVLQRVDVDKVVDRVDVDAVVARVDANQLMERIDIDQIVERIDINAIAAKIDVESIAERIDIDALVRRADLGPIIAQSTSGMLGEFLGLLRRQVVSLDDFFDRLTLHRRRTEGKPTCPPALAEASSKRGIPTREGQYAGGITRLLALLADIGAGWGLYLLFVAGVQAAIKLFTGSSYSLSNHRVAGIITLSIWTFVYFAFQWATSGRTIGMAILGARVVTVEGKSLSNRSAMLRAVVLPFSIVLWPITLFEIVLRSDRRTLHDDAAGTVVVYFWEARGASVPWLQKDD